MKTYATILQAVTNTDAIDFAKGYDFSEDEIGESPVELHDIRYVGTVEGVAIYYNVIADYHFFAPATA
jgi:hypothetical protein